MTTATWLELDGAVNARDLAGLPAADGKVVRPHRLVRSDNLQDLSEADLRFLVDEVGVRAVVDLRTGVEVRSEGQGPIFSEPVVEVHHLSLFAEAGEKTDVVAEDAPVVLPWQDREPTPASSDGHHDAAAVYLAYLEDRPDSVIASLRTIAGSDGATLVHCAAGKDRTGVVVALALAEVGVPDAEIVEDYARTAERIEAILDRLRGSATYRDDIAAAGDEARHRPRAETMQRFLAALDTTSGGAAGWLRTQGWTDADAAALRAKLLD